MSRLRLLWDKCSRCTADFPVDINLEPCLLLGVLRENVPFWFLELTLSAMAGALDPLRPNLLW
jgi:hypothetical protein